MSTTQLSVKEGSHLGLTARRARRGGLRELRHSDGSELIRLWCYARFILGDEWDFLTVLPFIYLFQSFTLPLPICQPISLFISLILSISPLSFRSGSSCCCEGTLQTRVAESTFFNGRVKEGHTSELQTEFAVRSTVRHEAIHCEQQRLGPRPFNRRPQRFLFTPIVLSVTGFSHVDVRECGIIDVFVCFNAECGRGGKKIWVHPIRALLRL